MIKGENPAKSPESLKSKSPAMAESPTANKKVPSTRAATNKANQLLNDAQPKAPPEAPPEVPPEAPPEAPPANQSRKKTVISNANVQSPVGNVLKPVNMNIVGKSNRQRRGQAQRVDFYGKPDNVKKPPPVYTIDDEEIQEVAPMKNVTPVVMVKSGTRGKGRKSVSFTVQIDDKKAEMQEIVMGTPNISNVVVKGSCKRKSETQEAVGGKVAKSVSATVVKPVKGVKVENMGTPTPNDSDESRAT